MDTPELRATAQGPADLWFWRWLSWAGAVSGAICWLLREQPWGKCVCVGAIYWPLRELPGENVGGAIYWPMRELSGAGPLLNLPGPLGPPVGSCPSRASSWVQAASPTENKRAEEKLGERGSRRWACPQPE